ncbi:MAG: Hpt domain-containing protein [Bacteroidota bacterium]|nr:Hpt domain-containing protein [Bacteroidota bacterium]
MAHLSKGIDITLLQELSGNSTEFVLEMLRMYLTQLPEAMSELEENLTDNNYKRISEIAHRIKPNFAYIGMPETTELMQKLERLGRDQAGDPEIKTIINNLGGVISNTLLEIHNVIENLH